MLQCPNCHSFVTNDQLTSGGCTFCAGCSVVYIYGDPESLGPKVSDLQERVGSLERRLTEVEQKLPKREDA